MKSQGGYMANLDLLKMNAADVIRQAVLIGGLSQEEVEAQANLRPGALDQFQSRRDPHWPNMLQVPSISTVLRTDIMMMWQIEQYMNKSLRYDVEIFDADKLLRGIAAEAAEFGDLAHAANKAIEDDVVDRKEALAIRREAMELVVSLFKIVNGVAGKV